MNHRFATRWINLLLAAVLTVGATPDRTSCVAAHVDIAGPEQRERTPIDETSSNAPELVCGPIQQRQAAVGPTCSWLTLRASARVSPGVRPPLQTSEEIRHVLLPRRTAPPEPDEQA